MSRVPPSITEQGYLQFLEKLAWGIALIVIVAGLAVLLVMRQMPEDGHPSERLDKAVDYLQPVFQAQRERCVRDTAMWENVPPSLAVRRGGEITAISLRYVKHRIYVDAFLDEIKETSLGGLLSRTAVPKDSVLTFEVSCHDRGYGWSFVGSNVPAKYLPLSLQDFSSPPNSRENAWM